MNPRRLYRCRHDRQLAGVAAGMAEYLEIDPTVVRILWILSIFLGGFTILLYIVLAFLIPLEPVPTSSAAGPAGAANAAGVGDAAGGAWADDTAFVVLPGDAPGAIPGWTAPDPHAHPATRGGDGRGGLFVGVLLVAFGVIAFGNVALPGWFAAALVGPAILVALGVALIAVAGSRRSAVDR